MTRKKLSLDEAAGLLADAFEKHCKKLPLLERRKLQFALTMVAAEARRRIKEKSTIPEKMEQ